MWNAFPDYVPFLFDRVGSRPEWNHRAINTTYVRSATSIERDHMLDAVRMVMTTRWHTTFQVKIQQDLISAGNATLIVSKAIVDQAQRALAIR